MNYLLTSVCWENTYSHQNPEFVSSLLLQRDSHINIYYPIDANTLLVCTDKVLKTEGKINVITISKRKNTQYMTFDEACSSLNKGYYVWNFGEGEPEIIFITIGDYCLGEMLQIQPHMTFLFPNVSYRIISIIELTKFCSADRKNYEKSLEEIFPNDKPRVIFFHGYPAIIECVMNKQILGENHNVLGYQNKSMASSNVQEKMIANECSRYHILKKVNCALYRNKKINTIDYEKNTKKINQLLNENQV